MRIPKRFKLAGYTINVEHSNTLLHEQDARGEARYRDNRITLQTNCEGNPTSDEQIQQAFCHELVHFLFHMSGYSDDRNDEVKVDRVANMLHQALTTAEYDEEQACQP